MTEKLVDDPSPPPDNLRCRRTDGKNWRCKNFSADNVRRYCIKHFISYQAIFNKSSKQNDNTDDKKKKDEEEEEVPSETQTKKTRLNETSSGLEEEKEPESVAVRVLDNNGGVGSLAKELESFAARVSNFSGGDCAFVKELVSLATGVSNTSAGCGLEEVESETLAEARVSNANGSGLGKDSESLAVGVSEKTSGGGGSWLKKTKTRFTKEQKEKMMEFGKRWGWRIRNNNEAAVRKFCDETGIKRVALKIWMYYTKHAIARASNSSGGGVGRRSPLKKRSYTKFTQEQKDKMVEFGERLGWRFRKQYMMQQFSDEIGVKVHVLKSWLCNKRKSLVSNPSGCGGGGGKLSKRGSRTLYTQEQMNKMMEFGERLGWRTRKKDKAVVQQFCDEIGVKVQTLKSWIQNKKISLGRNFSKKKSRTTFTQEQKDKMLEFGERLGWRIMKKDKAVVHQFCDETGVKVQTLKSWMQNQKNKLGYESQEGRLDSQSKKRKVETQKRCLEADTKRCSAEPQLGETRKHVGELEKVLEIDKTNELSVELEKKKMDCIEIQDKYRDGLKEWISCLEDQKVISEREKRAQERITNFRIARLEEDNKFVRDREKRAQERIKYMEEELTKARDEIEKFQLETSNRKFDCGKRRADDDIEVCGKRFSDLETRVLRMEEDNSSLRSVESHVCGHLDSEPQDLQNEDSHNDGGEIYEKDRKKRSKLQGKTNGGTKEKVFNANEKIHASTSAGNGTRESRADFQINKRKVGTGKERSETGTKRCGGDSVENLKDLLELEKDLEVYKTKYHEVSVELEKKKKECAAIQDKYEHGLKQWTSCLEDQKVIGVRQRSAQERITNLRIASLEEDKTRAEKRVTYLEEELRKTGRDEREKYVQLITDNKYLGCARRAAEDETEAWKKRFCVLEARVMRMEEENPSLRYMECHACGKREFGLGGLQKEFSHIDEGGINEKEINKLASAFTGYYAGPSSIDVQCEPFVNDEEKEKNTPSEFKVEYSNKVRKEVVLDLERNPGKRQSELKLGGFELASDGGDRDRDSENSLKRSWEIEENLVSKKCLKRLCLDQRGEEYGSNCADLTVTSIHNQKRTSEILNRESGDEVEVEMMKCPGLEHEVLKPSPMNLFSETSHVSSRGQDVKLRKNELEWKFEADMLSSFEENPELCMKAVCALYRRQTSEENPMTGFSHYTNRGFNEFDALRGTNLVEFLMDGDRKGDLKKSVKELEIFDPKALGECKRLAILYSEQLFNIYHNKEDPFFLPSSAVC